MQEEIFGPLLPIKTYDNIEPKPNVFDGTVNRRASDKVRNYLKGSAQGMLPTWVGMVLNQVLVLLFENNQLESHELTEMCARVKRSSHMNVPWITLFRRHREV